MKLKFVIAIVLLFTLTANAQEARHNADLAKTGIAPMQFTHADTVRALHNLFKSKRSTGGCLAYGSAAFTGIGVLAESNDRNRPGHLYFGVDGTLLLFAIGLAPAWIPGTVTLFRFTKKREQKALAEFERTNQVPRNLSKKLKSRFFNSNYRFRKPN